MSYIDIEQYESSATRRIYGEIVDEGGNGIGGAEVDFCGTTRLTDYTGNFEILNPDYVSCYFNVGASGYETLEHSLASPYDGQALYVKVVMTPTAPPPGDFYDYDPDPKEHSVGSWWKFDAKWRNTSDNDLFLREFIYFGNQAKNMWWGAAETHSESGNGNRVAFWANDWEWVQAACSVPNNPDYKDIWIKLVDDGGNVVFERFILDQISVTNPSPPYDEPPAEGRTVTVMVKNTSLVSHAFSLGISVVEAMTATNGCDTAGSPVIYEPGRASFTLSPGWTQPVGFPIPAEYAHGHVIAKVYDNGNCLDGDHAPMG